MHRQNEKRLLITSINQELKIKLDWYKRGLKEVQDKIMNEGIKLVNVEELLDITTVYLDGEPTTADRYNRGDEIEYKYGK